MTDHRKAAPERVEKFLADNREKLLGKLIIPNVLRSTLKKHPGNIALIEGETGKSWTYQQFDLDSNRVGNALKKLGIKRGDKVAQLHPNHPWFSIEYMGIQKIGATNVPLNPRYAGKELEYVLNHSDSVALFTDETFIPLINEIRPNVPGIKHIIIVSENRDAHHEGFLTYNELLESGSPEAINEEVDEEAISSLLYTSGTTGVPKGVMLSHLNCLSQAIMTSEVFGYKSSDIFLDMLPNFHCQYQCFIIPGFMSGITLIQLRVFDPAKCMEVIAQNKATITLFVPAMHNAYLGIPGFKEKYIDGKINTLRLHLYGGSIMPYPTIQKLRKWWPGVKLQNIFGMTETCASITSLADEYALEKIASVGPSLSHIDVKIVDDEGNELPQGEAGEILARGPTIMKGYYKFPEATEEALKGGWYHTGDVGKMDEDGFLYIVDRKKDMIVRGGENVYPAEVEKAILEHPAVAETAVIGVPDPRLQEKVKAFIAIKQGEQATEEELVEHCMKYIAKYKIPQVWEFIDALPRNAMGKVVKGELRAEKLTDIHNTE